MGQFQHQGVTLRCPLEDHGLVRRPTTMRKAKVAEMTLLKKMKSENHRKEKSFSVKKEHGSANSRRVLCCKGEVTDLIGMTHFGYLLRSHQLGNYLENPWSLSTEPGSSLETNLSMTSEVKTPSIVHETSDTRTASPISNGGYAAYNFQAQCHG